MTAGTSTNTSILIFGASGDLTSRKLIPALFRLHQQKFLPVGCPVIGIARRAKSNAEFREEMREVVAGRLGEKFDAVAWDAFAAQLFYQQLDIASAADYPLLHSAVQQLENAAGFTGDPTRIVYLATAPLAVLHCSRRTACCRDDSSARICIAAASGCGKTFWP